MRRLLGKRLRWDTFSPAFYWTATYVLRGALTVAVRWHVRGRSHVPREGPAIIVANHLNNADPPILAAAIATRRVRFMAKIELFRYPLGALIRLYGAFPVRRFESDARALLTAERILKEGHVLGMFPEGTRSRTSRLGPAHPGTALLALRTGAPVVPCAITGTQILANPLRLVLRPAFEVRIGEPFAFERKRRPSQEEIEAATARIHAAVRDLLPADYRPL